jgi:hypothetical protein
MNDLLELKGRFEHSKNNQSGFPSPSLEKESYRLDKLQKLLMELQEQYDFWSSHTIIQGALMSVEYTRIVPKSKRIKSFLSTSKKQASESIVGAKFGYNEQTNNEAHIITYLVSLEIVKKTINEFRSIIEILIRNDQIVVSQDTLDRLEKKTIDISNCIVSKTTIKQYLVDALFVEKFFVSQDEIDELLNGQQEYAIVTLYDTGEDIVNVLKKIGIENIPKSNLYGDNRTVQLLQEQIIKLQAKAPYLVSMAVTDLTEIPRLVDNAVLEQPSIMFIPKPKNEPIIGVIDTVLDTNVYFNDWVEYVEMVDSHIPITKQDRRHGTEVTSIIVDGVSINPSLDDGCGRFRVKHFGVAAGKTVSSFKVLKDIDKIIKTNKSIKVWNLSLGSQTEVKKNSISPEAGLLDKIQYENDVIFVIAGTNDNAHTMQKRIGSPADSINGIVVNAVDKDNNPAKYTRVGPVLSFFNKPDISCFGGDDSQGIQVCSSVGQQYRSGTSFAAPWIARKLAYMIYVLGLSKEVAKALLIDSAVGWGHRQVDMRQIGFGVVPTHIRDIVVSPDDEIRFTLLDKTELYATYNYRLPVPIFKGKYPFVARATMCCFPSCDRSSGVDYTSTELNLQFGIIDSKSNKIKPINEDNQDGGSIGIKESRARTLYRKWDNTKHIREFLKTKKGNIRKGHEANANGLWGIKITTKERNTDSTEDGDGQGVRFGVVITLKEVNGKNRIDDFIQKCMLNGWIVNKINLEHTISLDTITNEELRLDE